MGSLFIHNINMIKWNRAAKGEKHTYKLFISKKEKKKKKDTGTHEKNYAFIS